MGTLFLKIVLQTNMQPASIAFAAGGRSIDPLAAQQNLLQSVGPGTMPSRPPSPQEAQDVCACDGSLPSTKRIIAASRHFARRVASPESPIPRRLTWGVWRRAVAALAHWVRRRSAVAFATRSLNHDVVIFTRLWEIPNSISLRTMYKCVQIGACDG